ncbi:hypothetical protein VD659_12310 [Herbiconiux sp. 11R-BC]|uniref:hypothetical protein n=1 Tax=Herbiconiux sp. 11R-BC TaxID=3111637 RepID=UPI003C0612CB
MAGVYDRGARPRLRRGAPGALFGGGALIAMLLSGCVAPAASGSAADATAAASTPTADSLADDVHSPAPTPQKISATGDGPGTVEIPNPYYPLAEGRDRLTFTMSFRCEGAGGFWVQLLPESSGSYSGSDHCSGATAGTTLQLSRSQEVYVIDVRTDPGTTWTLTGTLAR